MSRVLFETELTAAEAEGFAGSLSSAHKDIRLPNFQRISNADGMV